MATKDRLIGADATVKKASWGSELTSTTSEAGAWYRIAKRSTNSAAATTAAATSIRAGTYPLWTTSGSGSDVIFTASAVGVRAGTNALTSYDTGVAGTFVVTTPGTAGVAEVLTLTVTSGCSSTGKVGITLRSATEVLINVTSTSGIFPAGYEVGDLWMGNGVAAFTVNDTAYKATFTELADITSFTLEYAADEVDVTVLADSVKKYRRGKNDMSGTVEGINVISAMNDAGSFINRFMRTVVATAANVSTLNLQNSADLYCQFMIQKDVTTSGETQAFLFAQIDLYGTSLGAAIGDAQTWSSGVRIIGNDPILYFKAN